ncbi:6-phospho-beta-glucosidase [Streptomyces albireticuli]|uniref:6-phospho-beta-glucosidase n=1 Tax=Streptomyces albireticuli TaxID=1940 RepID=A0A2A2DCW6_9ACTN|nr:6-phospho-beta-glucosidase [Streptomyces albireticuli]MCD9141817.1 6-phospho-beta-glucosidase [Streptomyces albireticuli]MCD9163239.1 6-phospho-beta-glucosidase [Streptomyces albireticuli]MCD9189990.1 6-phospho-beta-glucosidase [Streptomyces albireticuli]PAU49364.1 6-phospho-beta-glucosidase [Streptomyces albireticuli]
MRLTILGGGGFRVPLVHRALLDDARRDAPGRCTELVLYDTDPIRLKVIESVLSAQAADVPGAPAVRVARDLDEALRGADFVFSAIRVGGTAGRVRDERIPLGERVLGQETVGAGGVLYGLRTIPVAMDIAERVAAAAPDAWVINFTNPAGMVTEAMETVLGERVIGICDSPVGLVRRAARAVDADPDRVRFDYVGLNHLGWLRSLTLEGRELLPGLLGDEKALLSFEEGKLFGPEWLQALGALPNEYLHYYYFRRETLRSVLDSVETRGEFLDQQQGQFFTTAAAALDKAYELWERTRRRREETYMAESRAASGGWQRDSCDLDGGGYERVALALMRAISGDERTRLVLNVRNGTTVPALDAKAIIETVCEVSAKGARPLPCAPLREDQLGLMLQLKAVERAAIEAAVRGDRGAALRALALHPLVDSPAVAARILARSEVYPLPV